MFKTGIKNFCKVCFGATTPGDGSRPGACKLVSIFHLHAGFLG